MPIINWHYIGYLIVFTQLTLPIKVAPVNPNSNGKGEKYVNSHP